MLMRLSQAQLNLLETCPRKFQHVHLDQLAFPIAPEQQDRFTWGNHFHLLMQQRELGLPIHRPGVEADPLQACVDAFVDAVPDLFQPSPSSFRQSEHRRTLEFQGYLLTVVYDLLILTFDQAQILDWKTYPRPQQRQRLAENWQTRLYPFVLAETSDYDPEDISLSYWFVQGQTLTNGGSFKPESLQFRYSRPQHETVRQQLTALLHQLTQWLDRYQTGEPFPQIEVTTQQCPSCHYAIRCQRSDEMQPAIADPIPDLADVQEVAI